MPAFFRSPRFVRAALLFLLLALVVGIGTSALGSAFFWDDQFWIVENRFLRSWQFLPELFTRSITEGAQAEPTNFYRPLQAFTHFLDVQLYGYDGWWHHVSNLAIQATLAALLYFLFLDLQPRSERAQTRPALAAFFALTLWILHPLQSQEVAYLSGRGDLLCLSFMAGAALAWPRTRVGAALLCALAMLSKENGTMAPAFVFLTDWARREGRVSRRELFRYWPLAVPFALYATLRLTVLNFQNTLNFYNGENILTQHYSYRVLTYLSTLAKGAQLIFWPNDIHHERAWPVYAEIYPVVAAGAGVLLLLVGLAIAFRRRAPLVTAGCAWFLVAGLPTSNLIALINATLYDHWFLTPSLGIALAFTPLFRALLARVPLPAVASLWAIAFVPLSIQTWNQHATWRTATAQYEHILRFEPNSSKILNNLAMEYADQNREDEAAKLYQRSLALGETPQARNNLGNLYLHQRRLGEAEAELKRATELDPRLYQAFRNLGHVHLMRGDCAGAAAQYRHALEIFPDSYAQQGLDYAEKQCKPGQPIR